jgi:homoserine O-acetyltransferase/O-succinyltransferase
MSRRSSACASPASSGVISYRSGREWCRRFGRARILTGPQRHDSFEFEVEGYLERHAQRFAHSFDANRYPYLSRAIDLFDLGAYGESPEFGLEKIQHERALVVGVERNLLLPLEQQRDLASFLNESGCNVHFASLPSIQGHDSFLVDIERFAPLIGGFLERL